MHVGWIKQARIVNGPYVLIWIALLALSILVQFGGLVVAISLSLNPPRWTGLANVFVLPLLIPVFILALRRRRAFIAIIRANDGYVCISCGYPIDPKLDHTPCPECGAPIDLAHCRKTWLKHIGGW